MHIVNNQETHEGDTVFYIDANGQIHDAIIKSIVERDGNHYAEVLFERDGKKKRAIEVPHNTSSEKHSWNHPLSEKERQTHYAPDFYGDLPLYDEEEWKNVQPEPVLIERDYSILEYNEEEGTENA